jgi:hypothetical protein
MVVGGLWFVVCGLWWIWMRAGVEFVWGRWSGGRTARWTWPSGWWDPVGGCRSDPGAGITEDWQRSSEGDESLTCAR